MGYHLKCTKNEDKVQKRKMCFILNDLVFEPLSYKRKYKYMIWKRSSMIDIISQTLMYISVLLETLYKYSSCSSSYIK